MSFTRSSLTFIRWLLLLEQVRWTDVDTISIVTCAMDATTVTLTTAVWRMLGFCCRR